jgi:hypothetical protein
MSSETWQYIEELLALSPWVAFIVAIAWFWVLGLRNDARGSRAYERARPRQSDERIERGRSTNT